MQKDIFYKFLLILAFIFASSAHAVPVTYNFTGTIESTDAGTPALDSIFTVGGSVFGSYTYESTTPDIDVNPNGGNYSGALLNYEINLGGIQFSINPDPTVPAFITNGIGIANNFPFEDPTVNLDQYSVQAELLEPLLGETVFGGLTGIDSTGTAFDSDLLLPFSPELSAFDTLLFGLYRSVEDPVFGPSFEPIVNASLNTLTRVPTSVPEPNSLFILLIGLFSLGLFSKRIRK